MRDEDFTLGYVCGYNNAGGGGASGGIWLDDIPLIKKYKLVGTDCAIGIADPESDKVKIVSSWNYYVDGDNATVMDRVKWNPAPYQWYKPVIIIFFVDNKRVGYVTVYGGIYVNYYYSNAGSAPPYGDTWILMSKEEGVYDEMKFDFLTEETSSTNATIETVTLVLSYKFHYETWTSASGKTTSGNINSRTQDIFRKDKTTYSGGNVRVSTFNNIGTYVTGVGSQWLKPENLRDVLDAWFKCTGMEEVQI